MGVDRATPRPPSASSPRRVLALALVGVLATSYLPTQLSAIAVGSAASPDGPMFVVVGECAHQFRPPLGPDDRRRASTISGIGLYASPGPSAGPWRRVAETNPEHVLPDPATATGVLVVRGEVVRRADAAGLGDLLWPPVADAPSTDAPSASLAAAPRPDPAVFVATHRAIVRITAAGARPVAALPDTPAPTVPLVAASPSRPGRVLAVRGRAAFRSDGGGDS